MAPPKPNPIRKFTCKECGRTFLAELRLLWENKGKLECAHCGHSAYYAPSEAKAA
jgi:DNA-directed RNA polymerase subunit RPC12/RpoP